MYLQFVIFIFLASEISGKFEIFPQVPNYIQYGDNKICKMESNLYKRNLRNYTIWAHKMLDSSAKGTFGVLTGNEYQLGNYAECLNSNGPFSTQYCLTGVTINVPSRNSTEYLLDVQNYQYEAVFTKLKNVKLGMCFPSSCSTSDIQTSLTKTLNNLENSFKTVGITYAVISSNEFCSDYVNPRIFGVLETIFCILTVALLICALIGTIGDCLGRTEENPNKVSFIFKKLCLSFSIRRNWNELFKAPGHQEETQIFNGIRSISVIIIFISHFAIFVAFSPSLNSLAIDEMFNSKARILVEKIDLVVDVFFLMSGLLLVHGILKKWKTVNFNPIWLIFLRYIRLTPLNLYVTLYYVTMFPYFGYGPLWGFVYKGYMKSCVENNNWWLNIFYLNNFLPDSTQTCNEVNWYIACEFQLFICGVVVMFIMKKSLRVGYAILGLLIILSMLASFIITEIYKIIPDMDTLESEQYKSFNDNYYVKPYTRGSSYLLGMVGGIIYDKLKSKEVTISKRNSYAAAGLSIILMVVSYAYLIYSYNGQENYMFEYALYNALHRPIWCIGFLGICIVASFGSIPAVRMFLSSSFWTPLAKLSYGLFLSHLIFMFSIISTGSTVPQSGFFSTMRLFLAVLLPSIIISLILYVIVEAPFVQTFKIIRPQQFCEKPLEIKENSTVDGGAVTETE